MTKLVFRSVLLVGMTIAAACVQNSEVPGLTGPSEGVGVLTPPVQTPTARFTFAPENPEANASVFFDASSSCLGPADPTATTPCGGNATGSFVSYNWNFGDGSSATGRLVTHPFDEGTFGVSLTVVSSSGRSSTTTKAVTVTPPKAPVADFVVSPAPASAGSLLNFSSTSTTPSGAEIVSYAWNFGDGVACPASCGPGVVESSANVRHQYPVVGVAGTVVTYSVTLTIRDSNGQTHTKLVSVPVTTP